MPTAFDAQAFMRRRRRRRGPSPKTELVGGELERLDAAIGPLVRDADDVRDVVEPLQSASERLRRLAERPPGPGRKHLKGRSESDVGTPG